MRCSVTHRPVASCWNNAFVELALGSVIDILDTGLAVAQAGRTQADLDPLGIAISHLAIDQQREPFGV